MIKKFKDGQYVIGWPPRWRPEGIYIESWDGELTYAIISDDGNKILIISSDENHTYTYNEAEEHYEDIQILSSSQTIVHIIKIVNYNNKFYNIESGVGQKGIAALKSESIKLPDGNYEYVLTDEFNTIIVSLKITEDGKEMNVMEQRVR